MRLLGFSLTKIGAERLSNSFSDLKIETSINLDSVEENKVLSPNPEKSYLEVLFRYTIEYSKKIAKIELSGKVLLETEEKTGKEILKNWKKKDLKDELRVGLFNAILVKSNLKALQIEEELGLPPHFKLPSLTIPEKK